MDPRTFVAKLLPLLGGEENLVRQNQKEGCFTFTVKDSGAVRLEELCQTEGVAAAQLNRGRVRVTAKENYVEDIIMAKKDYSALIKDVLESVGGKDNILEVAHCMTRLRFNLKDDSLADVEKVKNISGVAGCVVKGGQFQVVIGTHVEDVYNQLLSITHLTGAGAVDDKEAASEDKKMAPFDRFLDLISGIFMPIVGAMAGSGMVKAILTILKTFGWIDTASTTYTLLYMISDTVFYFLPVFVAVSASKKLKCNTFVSLIFATMLVSPTMSTLKSAGDPVTLFGLPVTMASYTSSVIPIILIILFQALVEPYIKKYCPKAINVFMVPLVTILIVAPVGLIVLGPLGYILGNYLAIAFTMIDSYAGWLVPCLIGTFCPLLVMTGMHYGIAMLQVTQRATVGYGTMWTPGALVSNMATAGACFGAALRAQNQDFKSLASSCGITALCGITEPALYSVSLKHKQVLYASMIAGGLGGLYGGVTGIKVWSSGTSNIFSLPIFIGGDSMMGFYNACISVAIAIIVGVILGAVFNRDSRTANSKSVKA